MVQWKRPKFWFKSILFLILFLIVLIGVGAVIVFANQEKLTQKLLDYSNQHFKGRIELSGSHISPFVNFPNISIDLEGLKIYEDKLAKKTPILDIDDAYLGFDFWQLFQGNYQLKTLYLSDGFMNIIQHEQGDFNIMNALTLLDTAVMQEDSMPFKFEVESLSLHNMDVHKLNESNQVDLDIYINDAFAQLAISDEHAMIDINSRLEMNLIVQGDTTYFKHKHFDVLGKLDFDIQNQLLTISPSDIIIEEAAFKIEGDFDFMHDQNIDLKVEGKKSNFDLLIAFAPDELIPVLKRYENEGKVYFISTINGSLANGTLPIIDAKFGCEKGMILNNKTDRKVEEIRFSGYLKNNQAGGSLKDFEFGLMDFNARPEAGRFFGDLELKNFISPDIELKLNAQFELEFLTSFLELEGLSDLSGAVNLSMNFHDIIDLEFPERSIEKLNESYFTELDIRGLNFKSSAYHLPLKDIKLIAHLEGHHAYIDTFSGYVGGSNVFMKGDISDLPAIMHHTKDEVWLNLDIRSDLLDLTELTYVDSLKRSAIDEKINDFELDLAFKSSARAFTESKNLPEGEFFIRNLHAQLLNYPHEFHDFNADLFIEEEDLRLIDFSGELDRSDFHFSGKLIHYDFWLNDTLNGDASMEFDFISNDLYLADLLVYKGVNYIPEDYRSEDFQGLKLHGRTDLHFKSNQFHSVDLYLDRLDCKMKMHKCKFRDFNGRLHYEDLHLTTERFSGKIGHSDFLLDLYWYLGNDHQLRKKEHYIHLVSERLDVNQLLEWEFSDVKTSDTKVDHDTGFSIFNLPFWEMQMKLELNEVNYHQYRIKDLNTSIRMTTDRYIFIDSFSMELAAGKFELQGYFNASDSNEIYLSPNLKASHIDIDQFMVKFDNFGQDYVVSDNLHGFIDCDISGKVHIHKDLTPMLDKSSFLIDLEATDGRLDNYKPIAYLSDYFKDKNLNRIRFDTLRNSFFFENNSLKIPAMTINSSIGFLELWGEQTLSGKTQMNLFFKIPMKLITKAVGQKLFKKKQAPTDPDQIDEIEYLDESKKTTFVTVNLKVEEEEYKIELKNDKKKLKAEREARRKERMSQKKTLSNSIKNKMQSN